MIIECNTVLYLREKEEALGISGITDTNVKFAFDISTIEAVREAIDSNGNLDEEGCVIYTKNDSFWIDVPYYKIRDLWKQVSGKH